MQQHAYSAKYRKSRTNGGSAGYVLLFYLPGRITQAILLIQPAREARAQRACAESARAVTGRRWPHSGKEEHFLTGQLNFFTETAVTPERKVEKSFPRWEINRHAEG